VTFDLTGRVALITGAASGIGAATARVFATAGADLALAWYPPDGHDIDPVRRAAEKAGRRVVVAAVDVTQSAEVDALVARAARELGGPHITAAKAGLVGLVKSLAVEFGSYGITANAVAPGVIRTPQALDPVNSLGPEGVAAVAAKIPAGRVGTLEDIAYVFQFLASAEASYVNGQLLVVDGARSLAGLD
jgi:NAD(P)-dependent dehydrogenase (short-subunit alcohol dehydrogenase family)